MLRKFKWKALGEGAVALMDGDREVTRLDRDPKLKAWILRVDPAWIEYMPDLAEAKRRAEELARLTTAEGGR